MNNSVLTEALTDFVSLFFPSCCRGCDEALAKGENIICTKCLLEMPRTNYHLEKDNLLFNKFKGRLPVESVFALFKFAKGSRVQHLLHALKYKNQPELGVALGKIYGYDLLATYRGRFDLVVPVPLHKSKKRKRGYNQSEQFGSGIADVLDISCSDQILERMVSTETQTLKSKLNRWQNVGEVFRVPDTNLVEGKRILLVDDVITTGATLEACGGALLKARCASLSIACIAAAQ